MTKAAEMLTAYLDAEKALLAGKEFFFRDRRLTNQDLPAVIAGRQEWEARVAAENARRRGVPTLGGAQFSLANLSGEPHERR
jgi:hypothetical protein